MNGNYEAEILVALADEPLITPDLAARLAEDEHTTYRHCHRLEELRELVSEMGKSHQRMFYCVDCKHVVKDFDACRREGHSLRPFFPNARVWDLTDAGRERLQQLAAAGIVKLHQLAA